MPSTNNVVVGHGGPITITTGGTYTGSYQSNNDAVPAVTISTTQPVTLSRVHIIAKGIGVWAYDTKGTRLTIVDSVFDQINPGAVVNHRAVEVNQPASFVFEHNQLTDTDGVEIHGLTSLRVNPLRVSYNLAVNIGRYPHPTAATAASSSCSWTMWSPQPGRSSGIIRRTCRASPASRTTSTLYQSGGTDSTHRFDIGHNLIDGAYPRTNDPEFTGGGINPGRRWWRPTALAHDNTVVSTTNYGIAVNGVRELRDQQSVGQ